MRHMHGLMLCIHQLNPTTSRISLISHKAKAKPRLSINIKDIWFDDCMVEVQGKTQN